MKKDSLLSTKFTHNEFFIFTFGQVCTPFHFLEEKNHKMKGHQGHNC